MASYLTCQLHFTCQIYFVHEKSASLLWTSKTQSQYSSVCLCSFSSSVKCSLIGFSFLSHSFSVGGDDGVSGGDGGGVCVSIYLY